MTAPSLHRLAIDIDERQFADAIELAQDVGTRLERMKRARGVAQSLADESCEMRRIVRFQEQIDRDPMAADVARSIMGDRDVAHFPARRHGDSHRAYVGDDPTTTYLDGGRIQLLKSAQGLRR